MSDMTGPNAVNAGPGSLAGAKLAVEDFLMTKPGFAVEVISADMLNKPDVGAGIARQWYDQDGVDMILDVPSTPVALAVATIAREKDKLTIFSGAGLSDITGKYCGPNHIQWTYDLYANAVSTAKALLNTGAKTWFFIGVDNAAGAGMVRDVSNVVKQDGGSIVGSAAYPLGEVTDFSSYLVQAQASGAKVVCFTNAAQELSNCLKQASEFGLAKGGMRYAAVIFTTANIAALGLASAQGLVFTESFYWDMNDGTRAFAKRFATQSKIPIPTSFHAGCYSATWHYLKSVAAMGIDAAKASGRMVAKQMKHLPTEDPLFGKGAVREDGKFMHPMYVWQVKTPSESRYPYDYYKLLHTVPAEEAFQTIVQEGCDTARL
jgi:branched-chain amino acid transport system substrate-binding protein